MGGFLRHHLFVFITFILITSAVVSTHPAKSQRRCGAHETRVLNILRPPEGWAFPFSLNSIIAEGIAPGGFNNVNEVKILFRHNKIQVTPTIIGKTTTENNRSEYIIIMMYF